MSSGSIAKLFVTMGLDDSSLQSSLKTLQGQMQNVGRLMTEIGVPITAAMTGAIYSFTSTGSAIEELSQKTGMSTETLSALKYAAEQTGGSIDDMATMTKSMDKAITDLSGKSSSAQTAIKDLGLNLKDLQAMTPDQQFTTLANAIANVQDPTQKAALSMAIFGKSGTDLLPMLADGSVGLQTMEDNAKKLGVVFDQTSADSAVKMSQAFDNVKESVKGLGDNIGSTLAPILTTLVDKIVTVVESITNWMKANPELSKVVLVVVAALGALLAVVGPLLLMLPTMAASMGILAGSTLGLTVGAIAQAFAVGGLSAAWDTLTAAMLANPIGLIIVGIMALVVIAIVLKDNWTKIRDFFEKMWDDVLGFFKKAWDWLGNNWPYFLGLPGLVIKNWGAISGFFSTMWTDIVTDFKSAINLLIGLAEGFANGFISAVNFIISALDRIQVHIPAINVLGVKIGGMDFGINIPNLAAISLPRLAMGGIATSPTMALIGEAGPEAVIPLDRLGNRQGQSIVINMPVSGSILTDRDLLQKIQELLLVANRSNSTLGFH